MPEDDLGAAWAEAEAALPDGWRITGIDLAFGGWRALADRPRFVGAWMTGKGSTPAAAFRDLAARLQATRAVTPVTKRRTPVTEAGKLLLGAIEDDLREQGEISAKRRLAAGRRFAERIALIEAEAVALANVQVTVLDTNPGAKL